MDWVKGMLSRWGEVTQGGARIGSIGAVAFPAYQLVHIRANTGGTAPVDLDLVWLDKLMADVKRARPPLYEAAFDVYVSGMSVATVAGRQRCSRDTVYSRLNSLYELIASKATARAAERATTIT